MALLIMLLSGCADPYLVDTSHATKTEPKRADLVGTYVPDEATRRLISDVGGYPERTTSIELDGDGVMRITNIPDWWATPLTQTGFDSGTGTWRLKKWEPKQSQDHHWWIDLHFSSMKDFASDRVPASARPAGHPDVALNTGLLIVGEKPPFALEASIKRKGVKKMMRFTKMPATD